MADNDDVSGDQDATPPEETRPVLPPDPAAEPTAAEPAAATSAPAPVMKPRWRDRAWSFRDMVAVALATLVLGGVAGGAIVAVADDNDDDGYFRMGPDGPGDRMPGWRGPKQFQDGGPHWQWNDGPRPPDGNVTPYGEPSPTPPSPSQ